MAIINDTIEPIGKILLVWLLGDKNLYSSLKEDFFNVFLNSSTKKLLSKSKKRA